MSKPHKIQEAWTAWIEKNPQAQSELALRIYDCIKNKDKAGFEKAMIGALVKGTGFSAEEIKEYVVSITPYVF